MNSSRPDLQKSLPSSQSLRVSLSDFTLLKLLSTGGTSKVYLAEHNTRSTHLALKVISKRRAHNIANALTEQAIHRRLTEKHQAYFLPLLTSWHDSESFYLATEYQRGGDMSLELMRCGSFEEDRVRFYVTELIVALRYLHSLKIIHRDVKPTNILLSPEGHLILCDFGSACQFSETLHHENPIQAPSCLAEDRAGTPLFMSPEQHRGESYSCEVDYWALGVLFFRMLSGKMPFGRDTTDKLEIQRSVLSDVLSFENFSPSPEAQDILTRMLAKDPVDRISPETIQNHTFFAQVDWASLENRSYTTPWPPFLRFIPFNSRTTLPIERGHSYDDKTKDPFPHFYYSDQPSINHGQPCKGDQSKTSSDTRTLKKSRSLPLRLISYLQPSFAPPPPPPAASHSPSLFPKHLGLPSRTQTVIPLPTMFEGSHSDISSDGDESVCAAVSTDCDSTTLKLPVAVDWGTLVDIDKPPCATTDDDGVVYADALTDSRFTRRVLRKLKVWLHRSDSSES